MHAINLITLAFVRSLYLDAISRLRFRLSSLDSRPLLMTEAHEPYQNDFCAELV